MKYLKTNDKKHLSQSYVLVLLFQLLVTAVSAQSANQNISITVGKDGSFSQQLISTPVSPSAFEHSLPALLHISNDFSFSREKEKSGKNGITHLTFRQFYKGVKVASGTIILHTKADQCLSVNGKIMQNPGQSLSVQPLITAQNAIAIAQKEIEVKRLIKEYSAELVIHQSAAGAVLAYQTRVDAITTGNKVAMYDVYVSATTGEILGKTPLIMQADVPANAVTLYSGLRGITTDGFSGGYRLRDNGRKIETYDAKGIAYNLNGAPAYQNAPDFINASTSWLKALYLVSTTLQSTTDPTFNVLNTFDTVPYNGWALRSIIDKFVPPGYQNVKDGIIIPYYQSSPLLPATDQLNIPITSTQYRGAFRKDSINYGFDPNTFALQATVLGYDTNLIRYTIDNLTPGTHQWTSSQNDQGNYKVDSLVNPGVDVHWGIEKTYDFYKNTFNYYSYNNDSSATITNYCQALGVLPDPNNAQALPSPYFSLIFGAGDGITAHPFVALDVAGHEFTHLITSSNSALEYSGESGALNESFSDMMGTAIVYFSKGADSVTWHIGDGIYLSVPYLRSLSAPKAPAAFPGGTPQPDTYLGQYWADTTNPGLDNDNGGVHVNSGVGNKWFYLLAHGGAGTNDNQYVYNITGMGMDKAQQIAFSTFVNYLTSSANYYDSYNSSLLATADLYGNTSTEYQTVVNAWKAVGIPKSDSATTIGNLAAVTNDIRVYPNPSNGLFTIESHLNSDAYIEVYSISGNRLMRKRIRPGLNKVDLTYLNKGTYLVNCRTKNGNFTEKIICR